eukprot:INCI15862.1.p1 GENE.INCI15862.1~~INCI15862.1.p1  ORF type:complete len:373 (+),score=52.86 INCI15862.1:257-1375(+)
MSSDMNKEQAEVCVQIARKHIARREYQKAIKFLEKSQRLCDSADIGAAALLHQVHHLAAHASDEPAPAPAPSPARRRPVRRPVSATPSSSSGGGGARPASVSDKDKKKHEECERILTITDYYQVLGISRNADAVTVKKAYRKLALKFHPDKNPNVPRATDAFKHISKANLVLTDPDKKAFYDRHGRDPDASPGGGAARGGGGAGFVYEQAPDIFEAFFGGPLRQRRYHRPGGGQRRAARQDDPNGNNPLAQLLQLVPMLLLMLAMFSSSFVSVPEPDFSFDRTPTYGHTQRFQTRQGVDYWVDDSLSNTLRTDSIRALRFEQQVRALHIQSLQTQCAKEQRQRQHERMFMHRRRRHEEPLPSCEKLNELYHV